MIFDVDDFFEGHDRMDLLGWLKVANPLFRATVFAVPAFCSYRYLDSLPEWLEIVPHGWAHGGRDCSDPREAEHWTYEQAMGVIESLPPRFVHGWKSPGWQISDGTYEALVEMGYWVADQHYNDGRRPQGLRVHCEGDGEHTHTHVQNVCGNGLEEILPTLLQRVKAAESFEFVSEVVR